MITTVGRRRAGLVEHAGQNFRGSTAGRRPRPGARRTCRSRPAPRRWPCGWPGRQAHRRCPVAWTWLDWCPCSVPPNGELAQVARVETSANRPGDDRAGRSSKYLDGVAAEMGMANAGDHHRAPGCAERSRPRADRRPRRGRGSAVRRHSRCTLSLLVGLEWQAGLVASAPPTGVSSFGVVELASSGRPPQYGPTWRPADASAIFREGAHGRSWLHQCWGDRASRSHHAGAIVGALVQHRNRWCAALDSFPSTSRDRCEEAN